MQARYYDPVIGRFYSNDPIGFRDIHSFNRYAYANNNPYKFTDPTGMSSAERWEKEMEPPPQQQDENNSNSQVDEIVDAQKKFGESLIPACSNGSGCTHSVNIQGPLSLEQARKNNETDTTHNEVNVAVQNVAILPIPMSKPIQGALIGANTANGITNQLHTHETGDVIITVHTIDSNLMVDNFVTTQVVVRKNGDAVIPKRP